MSEFKIPPLSTLIGSEFPHFLKTIRSHSIGKNYYGKVMLTGLVCFIAAPFHLWERWKRRHKSLQEESPIFILGHWRSGTTLLHNLLCQDPNSSYVTTYHSLFPNNLHSKFIFKSFMKWQIPEKRPSDNVKLGVDLPQEDDFALANSGSAFYNFFYFPNDYQWLYDKNVSFKTSDKSEQSRWAKNYLALIQKTKSNIKGQNLFLKNPVNTARIRQLLKMCPKASFIHIHRNPVIVYLSTKRFFLSLFPTLQLQNFSPAQIQEMIFDLYGRLMKDYLDQRNFIPKNKFIEIAFSDLESDPTGVLKDLYSKLSLGKWQLAEPHLQRYLKELGSYKKNEYQISQTELSRIQTEWNFAFEEWDYKLPKGIKVTGQT